MLIFLKNEIILFTNGDINLEVELSPELETVLLTQKQMEELFDVKHATVSEHISNNLSSGELDGTSVGFSDKNSGGRKPKIYNLAWRLGHASMTTTQKTYLHIIQELENKDVDLVMRTLSGL